ncbi:NAD(P)-dependent alcohol dehydrogenase [Brachybacterium saurashtrense]|uniref:NAD(P)-dependent alcohol dehydrogenase n=1 Tax=Brachybacterium saurashtrense TaxID=556288 RepID=A0A345YRS3_9MICO|nr:NAD(P)-dependent alcohol dehydrogenase [Brachybacterium saurashtrense]AXK46625.1 NAD(P)-dependent alcohol dehydrogenase [Brachybacterium saurashtrense]RRR20770.1 NAD(P)-dependent alcohol dehydrogenase [Brachybacterium saurashtrense]
MSSDVSASGSDSTMRAVVFDRYGGPEVLRVAEVPIARTGPGEVLIRVEASSVNGGETAGRRGDLKLITGRRFPKRIGIDFVGTVVQTDADAAYAPVGTRVWGTVDERGEQGSLAEYIAVDPSRFSIAPAGLTPVEAATLLAGGTTALTAMRDIARLRAGERLLVRGASGGVGSVAVQVGAHLGAEVTGLAHPDAFEFVRAQKANHVLDYVTPPSQLGEFDVIFDTRGTSLSAYRRLLTPRGRMVTIAFNLRRPVRSLAGLQLSRLRRVRPVRLFLGRPRRPVFEELAHLAERRVIAPVVHSVHTMEDVVSAHAQMEHERVLGKVAVDVAHN